MKLFTDNEAEASEADLLLCLPRRANVYKDFWWRSLLDLLGPAGGAIEEIQQVW